jgi:predicted Zn-dependent peptidase
MKKINIEKTVLPNGLKVITSYKDSSIFSIGVGIQVGSLYEDESNNGISHMVEHMVFKGTTKRNVDELSDDIDKLAGAFDIYTTYHQTVLTVDVLRNRGKDSIEIIADMLMNSTFPEKEFKLEKKVIIEEIKMENDDAEDCSYLGLYKAAFPEEFYRYHIAGTIKSVKGINIDMLYEYYKKHYVPNNTVICVVSSYSHEEMVEIIKEHFDKWENKEVFDLSQSDRVLMPQKIVRHKTGIAQTHLLYGFDINGLSKKEQVALTLFNQKIGAGANSVLFRELRDRKGYAYNVYTDLDFIPNLKMFYIYAGISQENLGDTILTIDNIISRCKSDCLDLDEQGLILIKDKFLTDTIISLESSSHIVDYLLDGELDFGNPLEYQNFLEIMEGINVEDIKNVIDRILKDPIIHILSPK